MIPRASSRRVRAPVGPGAVIVDRTVSAAAVGPLSWASGEFSHVYVGVVGPSEYCQSARCSVVPVAGSTSSFGRMVNPESARATRRSALTSSGPERPHSAAGTGLTTGVKLKWSSASFPSREMRMPWTELSCPGATAIGATPTPLSDKGPTSTGLPVTADVDGITEFATSAKVFGLTMPRSMPSAPPTSDLRTSPSVTATLQQGIAPSAPAFGRNDVLNSSQRIGSGAARAAAPNVTSNSMTDTRMLARPENSGPHRCRSALASMRISRVPNSSKR